VLETRLGALFAPSAPDAGEALAHFHRCLAAGPPASAEVPLPPAVRGAGMVAGRGTGRGAGMVAGRGTGRGGRGGRGAGMVARRGRGAASVVAGRGAGVVARRGTVRGGRGAGMVVVRRGTVRGMVATRGTVRGMVAMRGGWGRGADILVARIQCPRPTSTPRNGPGRPARAPPRITHPPAGASIIGKSGGRARKAVGAPPPMPDRCRVYEGEVRMGLVYRGGEACYQAGYSDVHAGHMDMEAFENGPDMVVVRAAMHRYVDGMRAALRVLDSAGGGSAGDSDGASGGGAGGSAGTGGGGEGGGWPSDGTGGVGAAGGGEGGEGGGSSEDGGEEDGCFKTERLVTLEAELEKALADRDMYASMTGEGQLAAHYRRRCEFLARYIEGEYVLSAQLGEFSDEWGEEVERNVLAAWRREGGSVHQGSRARMRRYAAAIRIVVDAKGLHHLVGPEEDVAGGGGGGGGDVVMGEGAPVKREPGAKTVVMH
jgi:hypothetical protein